MRKLTEEQVRSIPELYVKHGDLSGVAEELGISIRQLSNHIRRLRELGVEVKTKKGPRPILKCE